MYKLNADSWNLSKWMRSKLNKVNIPQALIQITTNIMSKYFQTQQILQDLIKAKCRVRVMTSCWKNQKQKILVEKSVFVFLWNICDIFSKYYLQSLQLELKKKTSFKNIPGKNSIIKKIVSKLWFFKNKSLNRSI